jgi:hypothetical protein
MNDEQIFEELFENHMDKRMKEVIDDLIYQETYSGVFIKISPRNQELNKLAYKMANPHKT